MTRESAFIVTPCIPSATPAAVLGRFPLLATMRICACAEYDVRAVRALLEAAPALETLDFGGAGRRRIRAGTLARPASAPGLGSPLRPRLSNVYAIQGLCHGRSGAGAPFQP